jgi:diguanylate cyclase (GGDEF)-like protein/PAS domain S-box-containing protein
LEPILNLLWQPHAKAEREHRALRLIPRRALLLGLAIALTIIAMAGALILSIRANNWHAAEQSEHDVVTLVSHDIQRNFQLYGLSLQEVVDDLKTPGLLELEPTLVHKLLFDRSSTGEYLGSIQVVDEHGNVFIDSRHTIPERRNFEGAEFFQHHKHDKSQDMYVGHPFQIDKEGHYAVPVSKRLELADGTFAGVVVGSIDIAYFRDTFSKILTGQDSGVSLIMTDGTVLTRYPYNERSVGENVKGLRVFETAMASNGKTFITVPSTSSEEKQFVATHLDGLPMILIAARTTASIQRGWFDEAMLIGIITSLLLGACATLGVILSRELARRGRAESSLFEESERLRVTLASIGDAVISTDLRGRIRYMNEAAENFTGWQLAEAMDRAAGEILQISAPGAILNEPVQSALAGEERRHSSESMVLHHRDGHTLAVEDTSAPIRDRSGQVIGAIAIFHDVSKSREAALRMTHLAQHDVLTDLPNRVLLRDRLSQALERGRRYGSKIAVLFVDLDHFKNVNDSLGHSAGDQLLIKVAKVLQGCVRLSDTVSRQGGDEFVILITDHADTRGPTRVAEKILHALREPIEIQNHRLPVSASIGIAMFPDDGVTAEELIKNADAAMYLAKQSERNTYQFFTAALGEQATRRLQFESEIAEGLRRNEFFLHYQPQFRSGSRDFIGVEALVRWRRGDRIISPMDFIPVAEECGQIIALGERVLEMACAQLRIWQDEGGPPFTVAVNISAHQLRSAGFPDRVAKIILEHGVNPRQLEFEITESAILDAGERTRVAFEAFRKIGIGIALDDFGTGYSSLSNLKDFPITRVKIDKSFVKNIVGNQGDRAIVKAVITMADSFDLRVIAEGVETEAQMLNLIDLGCDELQGFMLGRPAPADQIDYGAALAVQLY